MKSSFMKSLGPYRRPETGETLETEYGEGSVSKVLGYREIVEEMAENGVSKNEIEHFDLRIENFLGKKGRYFECELTFQDGEVERIDWSEYLVLRNRRRR